MIEEKISKYLTSVCYFLYFSPARSIFRPIYPSMKNIYSLIPSNVSAGASPPLLTPFDLTLNNVKIEKCQPYYIIST